MADPVATVEKIVKIGLKIKEAVDTVRQNKEVCLEIRKSVLRYSAMLSQLQRTGVMNNSPAMSGALEDLAETLERALELVTACQERSTIRHFVSAGNLSKQLRRVMDSISEKVMLGLWCCLLCSLGLGILCPSNRSRRSDLYGEGNMLPGSEPPCVSSVILKRFRLSDLKAAIDEKNIIGQGGCCTVFKGVLIDGKEVAVKLFDLKSRASKHYFLSTYNVVSKCQHRNIVKAIGLLKRKKNGEEKVYLVEEYVPNGDLKMIIDGSRLEWSSVFRIIEGVAQGLNYLHQQHIVHRDVKPSNILLDSDMNPKITDFSVSVVLDDDEDNSILGTVGYIAPETFVDGILTTKCDVYAFGVTLLETVSCMCRSKPARDYPLYGWAWGAWQAGRVEELFDPSLFDSSQLMEIKRCMVVGFLCVQQRPADRPTMADVLEMLNGEGELPIPCLIDSVLSSVYSDSDGSSSP